MKLFKKLEAYNTEETKGAVFGFGVLRAKDYEKDRFGHLFLFSLNTRFVQIIKKLFIPI